jgi:hypothetical protein
VSVHPSGKVALSVGKDRTLYMWDLMRGKRAASMKLGFGEPQTRELALVANNVVLFLVQRANLYGGRLRDRC